MTEFADSTVLAPFEAMLALEAHRAEMRRLLESVAYCAAQRHQAAYLVVDCSDGADVADIRAYLGDGRLVDLWELDPMLWDDAHWATSRLLPIGTIEVVRPALHRG